MGVGDHNKYVHEIKHHRNYNNMTRLTYMFFHLVLVRKIGNKVTKINQSMLGLVGIFWSFRIVGIYWLFQLYLVLVLLEVTA